MIERCLAGGTDEDALPVLFDLIVHEGLVLGGGSTAITIVGAIRLPRDLGPAGQDHRHHPRRRRPALPVQALQSRFSAQEEPAGTAVDEMSRVIVHLAGAHRDGLPEHELGG